jgi:DNA-binding NtrC family response regulator
MAIIAFSDKFMGLADTQTTNQDRLGPARVLVVDDEPGVLRLVAMALVRWGYEVHTAPGPMQALQAVRELPCFDLLVSDVIMPEMCGPELAKQIRALCPLSGVVLMSGHIACESLPEHTSFIGKPFAMADLYAVVERALPRQLRPSE